jgi:hypothetical protein
MKPETIALHEKIIRLVRGIINAWDDWVQLQKRKT